MTKRTIAGCLVLIAILLFVVAAAWAGLRHADSVEATTSERIHQDFLTQQAYTPAPIRRPSRGGN